MGAAFDGQRFGCELFAHWWQLVVVRVCCSGRSGGRCNTWLCIAQLPHCQWRKCCCVHCQDVTIGFLFDAPAALRPVRAMTAPV